MYKEIAPVSVEAGTLDGTLKFFEGKGNDIELLFLIRYWVKLLMFSVADVSSEGF